MEWWPLQSISGQCPKRYKENWLPLCSPRYVTQEYGSAFASRRHFWLKSWRLRWEKNHGNEQRRKHHYWSDFGCGRWTISLITQNRDGLLEYMAKTAILSDGYSWLWLPECRKSWHKSVRSFGAATARYLYVPQRLTGDSANISTRRRSLCGLQRIFWEHVLPLYKFVSRWWMCWPKAQNLVRVPSWLKFYQVKWEKHELAR